MQQGRWVKLTTRRYGAQRTKMYAFLFLCLDLPCSRQLIKLKGLSGVISIAIENRQPIKYFPLRGGCLPSSVMHALRPAARSEIDEHARSDRQRGLKPPESPKTMKATECLLVRLVNDSQILGPPSFEGQPGVAMEPNKCKPHAKFTGGVGPQGPTLHILPGNPHKQHHPPLFPSIPGTI